MDNLQGLLNALVSNDADIESNLQKCLHMVDKENVEINKEIVDHIVEILKRSSDEICLKLVADIAKSEKNREKLSQKELFEIFLKNIETENRTKVKQALRCLCNICADNELGRKIFTELNGPQILLVKAQSIYDVNNVEWNEIICFACNCIQNMIVDSDNLQEIFIKSNAIEILFRFVERFQCNNTKVAQACITGISVLIENTALGIEYMSNDQNGILKKMVSMLHTANDDVVTSLLEEIFTDFGKEENTRELLCKNLCVETIFDNVEKRTNFLEEECTDNVMKEMIDLLVLITSGDASFDVIIEKNEDLLKRISHWIQSPNKYVQTSAGLMIGNYARSESTCETIVQSKIHENLINYIKEHILDETYYDRIQAFVSCLRNLCVSVSNRKNLIDSGLAELAIELVEKTILPIQYKALAVLRLLVQNNAELAKMLCSNTSLLSKVVELNGSSVVTHVPAECQRLLAAVIKYCVSAEVIPNVLTSDCLSMVLQLLSSDHLTMKNEGLIAFIMIIANNDDSVQILNEISCIEKVHKVLKQPDEQPQTLFNCLTLIQAMLSVVGGKKVINDNQIYDTLLSLRDHREEIILNKAQETIDFLQ